MYQKQSSAEDSLKVHMPYGKKLINLIEKGIATEPTVMYVATNQELRYYH